MSAEPAGPAAAPRAIQPQVAIDAENPWPGLDAFGEEAAAFFHGRETEAAELARLIGQAPLTVLFGKSGLGKTSLLQAGLFPRLRTQGALPVYLRLAVRDREGALIDQLTTALVREAEQHGVTFSPPTYGGSLWERLHLHGFALWSPTNRPLVPLFVLDQFEEVLTLGAENREAVERLRIDLADLVENRIPAVVVERLEASPELAAALDVRRQRYRVLLSFREDFLPEIEGWRTQLPSLLRNRFRLREMTAAQAVAAVVRSGAPAGLVDERTAGEIVRFVGRIQPEDRSGAVQRGQSAASPGEDDLAGHAIEPALLSLVCAELNKRRQQAVPPKASIDADLLRGTAPSIISDFYLRQVSRVPPATRRFIEEDLLTEGGYRSSFPVDEALARGALTPALLRTLVDGRLLRIEHQLGIPRVELTHDRLTDIVESERERSRARERKRLRRRAKWMAGGVAAVLLSLIGFGVFNWAERRASERRTEAAVMQSDELRAALLLAEEERQRAEDERRRAEAALQAMRDAQEEARLASRREQEAAERAEAEAARAVRENAVVSELYAPIRPAVLRIESEGHGMATAFLVTNTGLAVTTGHVVEGIGKRPLRALNFDNQAFGVTMVKVDVARDLALFRISGAANTSCLQLAEGPPSLDTAVVALSISPTRDWSATTGKVLGTDVSLGRSFVMAGKVKVADGDLIEVDLPAEGGFSGAPVLAPSARAVIGMGAYGMGRDSRRHYLIPAARIRAAFADELSNQACVSN